MSPPGSKSPVQTLKVFRAVLRADVAIDGAQLRVAEIVAHEHRIGDTGEDAAGGMAQAVQLHPPQPGEPAAAVIAAPQRRVVKAPAPAVADDVVVIAHELIARAEPDER